MPVAASEVPPATTSSPVSRSGARVAGALDARAIAALPFRIDLPTGVQLVEASAGPGAKVWTVRQGASSLAMIYAGPQSQFPIYDGDQVTVAGRISVVVSEPGRRVAMEHLFQREAMPQEIHIWVMASSGRERDLAEQIAQTLDPR